MVCHINKVIWQQFYTIYVNYMSMADEALLPMIWFKPKMNRKKPFPNKLKAKAWYSEDISEQRNSALNSANSEYDL